MPKPMYVWSGSAWVSVATEVESLATYATQSYADNTPAMKMIVPASVAVGSGSGSVATQGTVTFSGASSVSLNDVFSSTYDNYQIVMNLTSSANDKIRLRMRVSGADNTTSNYSNHMSLLSSTSTSYLGQLATATTSFLITSSDGTNSVKGVDLTVYNPFATERSLITGIHVASGASGAPTYYGGTTTGALNLTTSFTGFTIFPESGTVTGTIRVYGYKAG